MRLRHTGRAVPPREPRHPFCRLLSRSIHNLRRGRMRRSVLVALLALAGACRERPDVAGPQRAAPRLDANVLDPALSTALASAAPTTPLGVIVNYDETVTTRDAVTNSM